MFDWPDTWALRPPCFEHVTRAQWDDWHWQQRARIRTLPQLEQVLTLSPGERRAIVASDALFRVAMTPHYLSLMEPENPVCPMRLQAVPQEAELVTYPFEMEDPLAEEAHMPVPGITHRYPDRVLFYVSHNCPMYCRHCTRKRKVSDPHTAASWAEIEAGLAYIRHTPQVRDVLISGGDPLSLGDEKLGKILIALRQIPHVEVIRLGTRNPVTLPQRITQALCDLLSQVAPVYVHTHFNHPAEISAASALALKMLLGAGAVLGNQMVLLRGINDDPQVVLELNRRLLSLGCRPYYILQCDMARGISHFRTPLATGLEIVRFLRGRIGGMGVPDFVVDLPGGGGKIELAPSYEVARHKGDYGEVVTFENWQGRRFEFVDLQWEETLTDR